MILPPRSRSSILLASALVLVATPARAGSQPPNLRLDGRPIVSFVEGEEAPAFTVVARFKSRPPRAVPRDRFEEAGPLVGFSIGSQPARSFGGSEIGHAGRHCYSDLIDPLRRDSLSKPRAGQRIKLLIGVGDPENRQVIRIFVRLTRRTATTGNPRRDPNLISLACVGKSTTR